MYLNIRSWRFSGSLLTKPISEEVLWTSTFVFKHPLMYNRFWREWPPFRILWISMYNDCRTLSLCPGQCHVSGQIRSCSGRQILSLLTRGGQLTTPLTAECGDNQTCCVGPSACLFYAEPLHKFWWAWYFWMSDGKPITYENWNSGKHNNFL